MELINNILSKLNNWCFNFWIGFGNRAGWIRNTYNDSRNNGIIFCNLSLKHQVRPKINPKSVALLKKRKEKQSQKRDNYISSAAHNKRISSAAHNRRIKRKNSERGSKKGPKS